MRSAERDYTDEIFDSLGYWATWLPTTVMRLGDCGPFKKRLFRPERSLEHYGISFEVIHSDPSDLQHATHDGVHYEIQGSADNKAIPEIPQGKAGLKVSFSQEHGIVLVVRRARIERIEDIGTLNTTLRERIEDGDFPKEYAVITDLVVADSATILISSGGGASFTASAAVDLKAGLLDIANAGIGLTRMSAQHLQTEIVAAKGIAPLFKLAGFKRGGIFWGSPSVGALEFDDDADPGILSEVTLDDFDADEG